MYSLVRGKVTQKEHENLFEPTLQDHVGPTEPPWRLDSQFFVAFFGGPLAIGAIAYLNAGRLGMPPARRYPILWIAAGAVAAEIALLVVLSATGTLEGLEAGSSPIRLINQGAGVVAYPFIRRVQRSADRVFQLSHEDEDYGSLLGPGLLAVVVGGLVGIGIVLGVLGALT